jgi:hypothetical protein
VEILKHSAEIVENLEAALEEFCSVQEDLTTDDPRAWE